MKEVCFTSFPENIKKLKNYLSNKLKYLKSWRVNKSKTFKFGCYLVTSICKYFLQFKTTLGEVYLSFIKEKGYFVEKIIG